MTTKLKVEKFEYTPYGELWVEDTDAAYHTPFRFISKEWDEETELYYYGARYMHARNSTWISADPAGFELVNPMEQDKNGKLVAKQGYSLIEGVNWYSYCSNNPVKYVDPSGLEAGEPFESIKDAVIDWAQTYYDDTNENKTEYASTIYSYTNNNGDTVFSYTTPNQGKLKSSKPSKAPKGTKKEATIHSHNEDNSFSEFFSFEDMKNAEKEPEIYLITGAGDIRKYDDDKLSNYARNDELWHYSNDGCRGEPLINEAGEPIRVPLSSTNGQKDKYYKSYFLFFKKKVKP